MTDMQIVSDTKITLMKKREPSEKDKELLAFIESVDSLQSFLISIGKHDELWDIFLKLMYYIGACMIESLEDNPKKKGGAL